MSTHKRKYYTLTALDILDHIVILFGAYDISLVVEEMRYFKEADWHKLYRDHKIEVSEVTS